VAHHMYGVDGGAHITSQESAQDAREDEVWGRWGERTYHRHACVLALAVAAREEDREVHRQYGDHRQHHHTCTHTARAANSKTKHQNTGK
jgi:hypothetical protein